MSLLDPTYQPTWRTFPSPSESAAQSQNYLGEVLQCEQIGTDGGVFPDRLYRLNRLRLQKDADASTDAALRQDLDAFVQQVTLELADPSLREPCRKVLASLQEHWPGLTLFVADPRIPMDNNLSERRLRGPALLSAARGLEEKAVKRG